MLETTIEEPEDDGKVDEGTHDVIKGAPSSTLDVQVDAYPKHISVFKKIKRWTRKVMPSSRRFLCFTRPLPRRTV